MSVIDVGITRDGYTQLRRRWIADEPRAVILLVHGMAEHSGRYEHIGDTLAQAGYHLVSFDLRGHGSTAGRRTHVDEFAQFLDDVEDHLTEVRKVGLPVVLFGHSLGGLIAARYAVDQRPQPDLLILSAPALQTGFPAPPARVAAALGATAPTLRLPAPFGVEALSRDEDVQRAYLEDPLVERSATVRLGTEMLLAMDVVNTGLDRLRIPTLVIHGGEDQMVPRAASEPLAELPRVDRTVYEGLRHEVLNEPEWELVTADIVGWLDAQLGT